MKFSIPRIFDTSRILGSKIGSEIKEFLEYFTQLQDQVVRLSQNNVTLEDNLKILKKRITVRDGMDVYEVTGLPFGSPTTVIVGSSSGSLDNPILFNWRYDGRQGRISVYLKAVNSHIQPIDVELIIFLK